MDEDDYNSFKTDMNDMSSDDLTTMMSGVSDLMNGSGGDPTELMKSFTGGGNPMDLMKNIFKGKKPKSD
jgi:hypothetical protein